MRKNYSKNFEKGNGTESKCEGPNAATLAAIKEFNEIKTHPERFKQYASFDEAVRDVLGGDWG